MENRSILPYRVQPMLPGPIRLSIKAIIRYPTTQLKPSTTATRSFTANFHRAMATATNVQLSLEDCGEFHLPDITADSAAKGSEILQENHDSYHIFFNKAGYHSMYPQGKHLPPSNFATISVLRAFLFRWLGEDYTSSS